MCGRVFGQSNVKLNILNKELNFIRFQNSALKEKWHKIKIKKKNHE